MPAKKLLASMNPVLASNQKTTGDVAYVYTDDAAEDLNYSYTGKEATEVFKALYLKDSSKMQKAPVKELVKKNPSKKATKSSKTTKKATKKTTGKTAAKSAKTAKTVNYSTMNTGMRVAYKPASPSFTNNNHRVGTVGYALTHNPSAIKHDTNKKDTKKHSDTKKTSYSKKTTTKKATTSKNYSVKKTYKINQDVKNAIEKIKKAAQKKAAQKKIAAAKKAAMKNMMKKMAKAMTKANSHKSHKSHNSYKTFRMAHHG
ncbi:MAG: hypothetical protein K6F03_06880 [Saccharofermentans sp.]|nr:hypothetical protein [Saccharofermentans sp.]